MASLNKVQLIGHLGTDPEIRHLPNGTAVATFNVATTERWTDNNNERREKTEWHRVEVWARLAEFMGQYAKKGAQVYVEGSLGTDKYTDKDGIERYSTKIKGMSVQLLDRAKTGQGDAQHQGDDAGHDNADEQGAAPAAAPAAGSIFRAPVPAAGVAPRRGYQARTRTPAPAAA